MKRSRTSCARSFLIIPAAIGVMFASSLARQLAIGWVIGTLTSAAARQPMLSHMLLEEGLKSGRV